MGETVSPPLSLHSFFSPFSHLPLLESSFATSQLLWTVCPARGWGWEGEGDCEKQEEGRRNIRSGGTEPGCVSTQEGVRHLAFSPLPVVEIHSTNSFGVLALGRGFLSVRDHA